jgi:hypothetical protein
VKVDRIRDENEEVVAYKAYSKAFPELKEAEAEDQYHAIQGYHRRMQVFQGHDGPEAEAIELANATDVSPKSKDGRTRN